LEVRFPDAIPRRRDLPTHPRDKVEVQDSHPVEITTTLGILRLNRHQHPVVEVGSRRKLQQSAGVILDMRLNLSRNRSVTPPSKVTTGKVERTDAVLGAVEQVPVHRDDGFVRRSPKVQQREPLQRLAQSSPRSPVHRGIELENALVREHHQTAFARNRVLFGGESESSYLSSLPRHCERPAFVQIVVLREVQDAFHTARRIGVDQIPAVIVSSLSYPEPSNAIRHARTNRNLVHGSLAQVNPVPDPRPRPTVLND
jgi:hypothetical protein